MLLKKSFEKYYIDADDGITRDQVTASVWLNKEGQQKFYELGCRLRCASPSKLFNQAMDLALEKLRGNEKIAEFLYANGRNAKRKGVDDIDLIQIQLKEFLGKTKR